MTLSHDEAAQTLSEIARTGHRSAQAHHYASASPQFILWGLIWVAGYTGSYLLPNYGFVGYINWLWFGLSNAGVIGGILIGRHQHRHLTPAQQAEARVIGFRTGMSGFAAFLFVVATVAVMQPADWAAIGAFVPLMIALFYIAFGLFYGPRFVYAGIVVAALTLGGWFVVPQLFLLWMALVGGGSLVLVGLWLKKV